MYILPIPNGYIQVNDIPTQHWFIHSSSHNKLGFVTKCGYCTLEGD
jgi:hypothetical protein